jgi:hypothetical protein
MADVELRRVAVLRGQMRGRDVDIEYQESDGVMSAPTIVDTFTRKRLNWTLTADEADDLIEIITAP